MGKNLPVKYPFKEFLHQLKLLATETIDKNINIYTESVI